MTQLLLEISQEQLFVITPKRRDQVDLTPLRNGGLRAAVVLHHISGNGQHSLNGDAGLDTDRLQIDCVGYRASHVAKVALAIRKHLRSRRGLVEIPDIGEVFLCDCQYGGNRDLYHPPVDGSEQGAYGLAVDFTLTLSGVTNE